MGFPRITLHVLCVVRSWTLDNRRYPGPEMKLADFHSYTVEETNRRKFLAQAYMPRDNYFTRPFRVDQPASEQSSREQAWAKVNPTEWRHTASTEPVYMWRSPLFN